MNEKCTMITFFMDENKWWKMKSIQYHNPIQNPKSALESTLKQKMKILT